MAITSKNFVVNSLILALSVDSRTPVKGWFTNPKIAPSDLDGIVERNGYFLIFECKHENDSELSHGQLITLQRLAANSKTIVIEIMLSGLRTDAGALLFEPIRLRRIFKDKLGDWQDTDIGEFRERCYQWSQRADFGQFAK